MLVGALLIGVLLIGAVTGDIPSLHGDQIVGVTHPVVQLPIPGQRVRGFRMSVEVGEQSSVGYVPVKITTSGTPVITADRRFVIRFKVLSEFETPHQNGLEIDVPVFAPEGIQTETVIRYLPKWSAGQALEFQVMEEGRELSGYDGIVGGDPGASRANYWGVRNSGRRFLMTEYGLNFAYIGPQDVVTPQNVPDLFGLHSGPRATSRMIPWQAMSDLQATDWNSSALHKESLLGQTELPEDWRAYQRLDVIVVDPSGVNRLVKNQKALTAVRDWILNGGTLMAYNVEQPAELAATMGFSWPNEKQVNEDLDNIAREHRYVRKQSSAQAEVQLAQINEALALADDAKSGRFDVAELQQTMATKGIADGYRFDPDRLDYVVAEQGLGTQATDEAPEDFDVAYGKELDAKLDVYIEDLKSQRRYAKDLMQELVEELSTEFDDWVKRVQVRPVGAGQLITLQSDSDRQTPHSSDWEVASRLIDFRASPMLRRGVDPMIGDRRFGRWMIPGVAQPPVYTFMGLLTLFVILVGPVAYRKTSKLGRSYLMFAIAPALALVTTAAMFGYGIISDGFGTMVRIRQLTWVDGSSGDAGERVRSTYFAGVRPSDGLRFAGDAELMIYPEGTGIAWEDRDGLPAAQLGRIRIEADSQHLDSSFLPSREQRQFVTHAPRNGVGYLRLIPDQDGINSPRIENGFDFPVRTAVMRDGNGIYWQVDELGAGETRDAESLSGRDASKLMGQIYNDHRPVSEVRETGSGRNNWDRKVYDVLVDTNRLLETRVSVQDGVFERWLQRHMQTMGEIPDRHFVAVCDVSPDVLAVEGCDLKASVRYVFGTLR